MAAIHGDEVKCDAVRIALTSGLTRRQVASDFEVGHSSLCTWIRAFSDESQVPGRDADLLRENERLRKENRILKELQGSGNSPRGRFLIILRTSEWYSGHPQPKVQAHHRQ